MIKEEDESEMEALYSNDRFHFARLMAHTWFNILKTMTREKIAQLKSELAGFTMIGEYVGNQNYQHLVLYPKVTILFYAMVENSSPKICLPPT